MNAEQALNIIAQALNVTPLTRPQWLQVEEALAVIQKAISTKDKQNGTKENQNVAV